MVIQLVYPPLHYCACIRRPSQTTHFTSSKTSLPIFLKASKVGLKKRASVEYGFWKLFGLEVPVDRDPGKDSYDVSDTLLAVIADFLGCKKSALPNTAFTVTRKAFDARKDPKFVYNVDLNVKEFLKEKPELKSILLGLQPRSGRLEFIENKDNIQGLGHGVKDSEVLHETVDKSGQMLSLKSLNIETHLSAMHKKARVIIVGSGPAGLFASLVLAERNVEVVLVERGYPVEQRGRDIGKLIARHILNPESNFCYGEGGAGTWSDGKLTTRIGKNSREVQTVLATLVRFGAPAHILVEGKPHIGTDKLICILRSLRSYLQALGVNVMFGTRMDNLIVRNARAVGVEVTKSESICSVLESDAVILAVGHSARDVYSILLSHNVLMDRKDFSVGFRVEHPQELINLIQYKKWAGEVKRGKGKVPVADYKVATTVEDHAEWQKQQRGCYSFCMCPGGQVVSTSTHVSELCVNGMSFSNRGSKWANAAIVVAVSDNDFRTLISEHGPLAGVAFQKALESEAACRGGGNLVVPAQTLPDFLNGTLSVNSLPPSSYRLGVKACPLHDFFPSQITDALKQAFFSFEDQLHGFISPHALLHAVETRTSAPIRINRAHSSFESVSLPGLYPIGEGAGYAGGIVSAAVDGMLAGLSIAKQLGVCEVQNLIY